jgi:effector-binding domain-containing protein
VESGQLTSWLSGIYGTLASHLQRIGVPTVGLPFARFHEHGDSVDVEAGFVVAERITPKDEVKLSSLPGGQAAVTWHRGHPDDLEPALEALDAWMQQQGVEPIGPPWAVHHSDPTVAPDQDTWMTELVQPFRD